MTVEGLSYSVIALLLIQLDRHRGIWISVAELAPLVPCQVDEVQRHCEALADAGQIRMCGPRDLPSELRCMTPSTD